MEQLLRSSPKTRIEALDSLRGFLMLCVILGHFLEILPGFGASHPLYLILYGFHMPAFIFLSGCLGKLRGKALLRTLGLYLLFQFLYSAFDHLVLCRRPLNTYLFNGTRPYWLLWYLLTLTYYYLSIFLLKRISGGWRLGVFALAVVISLLCGCINTVGYPFSLSRTLVFYPYFVAGFYVGQEKDKLLPLCRNFPHKKLYLLSAGILVAAAVFLTLRLGLKGYMLYCAFPYNSQYTVFTRIAHLGIASVWIHFLFSAAFFWQRLRLPVLSFIGRHSLYFYLFHGFIIKLLDKWL